MNTVPVWIVCTTYPGSLDNIVTVCVSENNPDRTRLIIFLLKLTFVLENHCVRIQPTNMDRVIFNTSGCHGGLTLRPCSAFAYYYIFQREREERCSAVYLSHPHTCTRCGKVKHGGREKSSGGSHVFMAVQQ